MIKNLFVGGLPYETTQEELTAMFAACGTVAKVTLIMDGFTGRTKGFGFVEMATEAEAEAAIAKLNGTTLGERQLFVSEARPQERRPAVLPEKRPGGTPAMPAFVERRCGLKDRRRQNPVAAAEAGPAERPRPDAAKHEGLRGRKSPSGKPFRPVRKPKDFGGRKKWGGKRARPGRRDVKAGRSRSRKADR